MNISVVVPVYNVEPYIERCLRSIMSQTFTDGVECILVNDCTPDKSMEIAEHLIEEYKGNIQFRIISHERNRGIAAVRNTGLNAAQGTYIQYIDSDDYVEPDMLEKLYEEAVRKNSDIIITDFWNVNKNCETYVSQCPNGFVDPLEGMLTLVQKSVLWNKFCRRTLFSDNHICFDETINLGEDLIVCLHLFSVTNKIEYLPFAFVHYVVRYGSMSNRRKYSDLQNLIFLRTYIMHFFEERGLYARYQYAINVSILFYQFGVVFRTKGKLQEKLYCEGRSFFTPINVIRCGYYLKQILGRYYLLASFFLSLGLLPVFNLMRLFRLIIKLDKKEKIVLFDGQI